MKTSIIIPARNEQFLVPTVADVLSKARGDIEVIAVLDGYWPNPMPADHPNLRLLHVAPARGMRPGITAAARMATGDFIMKLDGHCMVAEGFDEQLKADYLEDDWILTPRRYPLDAENWTIEEGNPKYPIDYEYLSYPFERLDDPTCGLHGTFWTARRDARKDIMLDEDMSSQGSCWFMSRSNWERITPLRVDLFGNFYGESQEIGLQTQMRGGAMMRTKNTWYAHLRKGKKYGRGYALGAEGHRRGAYAMLRMCMLNEWPGQTKTLQSLVERFMPVPGWPADLDKCFAEAKARISGAV